MNDSPDWAARAASEARDEQRRHPRPYPLTDRERLETEYTPEPEDTNAKDDRAGY